MIRLWDWVLRTIAGDWDHLDFESCRNVPDDADEAEGDEFLWERAVASDMPE